MLSNVNAFVLTHGLDRMFEWKTMISFNKEKM